MSFEPEIKIIGDDSFGIEKDVKYWDCVKFGSWYQECCINVYCNITIDPE